MGKIFWYRGITARILGNDHNPPHVHLVRGADNARYNLLGKEWMEAEGFSRRDLRLLEEQILKYAEQAMEEWERLNEK